MFHGIFNAVFHGPNGGTKLGNEIGTKLERIRGAARWNEMSVSPYGGRTSFRSSDFVPFRISFAPVDNFRAGAAP